MGETKISRIEEVSGPVVRPSYTLVNEGALFPVEDEMHFDR
jgi:hypothetical protein